MKKLKRRDLLIGAAATTTCLGAAALVGPKAAVSEDELFRSPYSSRSLWNTRPINPVLESGSIDARKNWPSIGFAVSLNYAGPDDAGAIIRNVSVLDELSKRDLVLPHFPKKIAMPPGSDKEVVVYDATTGLLHSFWQLQNKDGVWSAVSYACDDAKGWGWGLPSRPYNIRAAGCSPMGGVLRAWELAFEFPRHALAMTLDKSSILADGPSFGGPRYPATCQDAKFPYIGNAPNAWPIGTLFMLPASFDPSQLDAHGARKIAQTLKVYGAYLIDHSPGGINYLSELADGWSNAYSLDPITGTWANSNDLRTIRDSLRAVKAVEGWLDGDANAWTPPSWDKMQLLSMRGPWVAVSGKINGGFDTVTNAFVAPAGAAFTAERVIYEPCKQSIQGWWWNWAETSGWFSAPKPGRQYRLSVIGTGALTASLAVKSSDLSETYFAASINEAGQKQTFAWPEQEHFATVLQVSNPGAGGEIRLELLAV